MSVSATVAVCRIRESVRLHRTLRDLRVPADVTVVSRGYADRWREVRGGLVHAALSQGLVLAE